MPLAQNSRACYNTGGIQWQEKKQHITGQVRQSSLQRPRRIKTGQDGLWTAPLLVTIYSPDYKISHVLHVELSVSARQDTLTFKCCSYTLHELTYKLLNSPLFGSREKNTFSLPLSELWVWSVCNFVHGHDVFAVLCISRRVCIS